MDFEGFVASDFAAYEEAKWASNVYTLERRRVREKLQCLLRVVVDRLPTALLAGLEWSFSDDHPSILNNKCVDRQWGYAYRDERDRHNLRRFVEQIKLTPDEIFNVAPYYRHAILAAIVDQAGLRCELGINGEALIDRSNLAARLLKPFDRETFLGLWSGLPAGASLVVDEQPLTGLDTEQVLALASRLAAEPLDLRLGWSWAPAELGELGGDLIGLVAERLSALAGLYRYAAWSRDNDHIQVAPKLEQVKKKQRTEDGDIKVGRAMRIVGGLFTGKHGKVLDLDGRGSARLQIGPLAIVVALKDLRPV